MNTKESSKFALTISTPIQCMVKARQSGQGHQKRNLNEVK